ncbi:hypothetical protein Agub_g2195 [Astrephomene gubernaculifera]|uniref:Uncharacterized protein n=1 Tax=Astrephomene gubernaculifera TaxID=47775 RepID=A0AAD3DGQ1_9CHLO|nr:hypothetical protein Agub_g2195 [Astrephomene gubernaculifera]
MADQLGPLAGPAQDPLDELGGLVGQTLNIFDGQGVSAAGANAGGRHPLDVFGAGSRGAPDSVAQSIDLDLLGSSSPAATAQTSLLRSNTAAPDAEIPLSPEEIQVMLRSRAIRALAAPPCTTAQAQKGRAPAARLPLHGPQTRFLQYASGFGNLNETRRRISLVCGQRTLRT